MNLTALAKKISLKQQQIKVKTLKTPSIFVGFDGFTDEIIYVVDKVLSEDSKTYIQSIKDFGSKILKSSKKSCSLELVQAKIKIGGNAPIFTNSLLEAGFSITFAGLIGFPGKIEPLFKEMAKRCVKTLQLGPSGKTDALEFQDGKIILGKHESLKEVSYTNLLKQIDESSLIKLLDKTDLLVTVNWSMLLGMTEIWRHLLTDIVPKFSKKGLPRYLFVDLADPAKRSDNDLLEALKILAGLNETYEVILGLNISETEVLCKLFKVKFFKDDLQKTLNILFERLKVTRLLVHSASFAVLKDRENYQFSKSFYTEKPLLTTGAGDNFNAGYCNALLMGFNLEEALMTALATSGYYVRMGLSPTMDQLCKFLKSETY